MTPVSDETTSLFPFVSVAWRPWFVRVLMWLPAKFNGGSLIAFREEPS